jgi:hypothetical protein
MAKKKPPAPKRAKPPEKSQKERFINFAREHGADDAAAVDRALKRISERRSSKNPAKDSD